MMAAEVSMAKLLKNDGRSFTFSHHGRTYCVPFGRKLVPRNATARKGGHIASVTDNATGHPLARWGTVPKQRIQLASLAEDYDLSSFVIEGEALPPERTPMPTKGEVSALVIVTAQIAGLPLEVVEGEWVTLRSLFEPFGKRVASQLDSLGGPIVDGKNEARTEGWAKLRKFPLSPRMLTGNRAENLTRDGWCVHRSHAAQAIADLSTAGMDDNIRASFVAFKRECAGALDAYFTKGVAENPRMVAAPVAEIPAWSRALLEALGSSVVEAKGEIKAMRGDVEAVAGMVAEVDKRKVDRAEVEALREEIRAATEAPKERPVATVSSLEAMSVSNALRALGLPRDRNSMHKFAFGRVLFQALDRSGHTGRTWPVSKDAIERARPHVERALAAMRRDGFAIDDGGLLTYVAGGRQFEIDTLIRHMLKAMRDVPGGGHGTGSAPAQGSLGLG